MPRGKKFSAEQIIGKLREAEVEIAKGQSIGQVAKKLGITEQTYYRWRTEYGGLRTDHAKRLKDLEKENARLRRLVANQALDMEILREAASGNFSMEVFPASIPWLRKSYLLYEAAMSHSSIRASSRTTGIAPTGISRRRLPHLSTSVEAQSFPERAFVTGCCGKRIKRRLFGQLPSGTANESNGCPRPER